MAEATMAVVPAQVNGVHKPPTQRQLDLGVVEQVLIKGDLSKLNERQRTDHYLTVCRTLGLNPATQPFAYLQLSGKLTLYAKRDCTDQLRMLYGVSVRIKSRDIVNDLIVVTAEASTPDGRVDESIGAVSIDKLKGEALANAMMKAETKAKRRVTLSLCGLGFTDESEVDSIPGAKVLPAEIVHQPQLTPEEREAKRNYVKKLLSEKVAEGDRLKFMAYYNVESVEQLTDEKCDHAIEFLEKRK